ncbi:hypothetical protein [uncultured Parabacteroides sp.]|uniref:hypothetical protein n=1 Tax=uncultured Parabacteroides sp. TaxID=512312 RepID=UPI0025FB1B50|nr:hypothetical protein [uncultured Parabacteroides sp.]
MSYLVDVLTFISWYGIEASFDTNIETSFDTNIETSFDIPINRSFDSNEGTRVNISSVIVPR